MTLLLGVYVGGGHAVRMVVKFATGKTESQSRDEEHCSSDSNSLGTIISWHFRVHVCLDGQLAVGSLDGGWKDGWMDGWMDGRAG